MRPLIIVRPQPGADATAQRAVSMGLICHVLPLFSAAPRRWTLPASGRFDALLLTSANAVRQGGDRLAALAHLPCHAVGAATATAAQAAGLHVVAQGRSGAQSLVDAMIADGARSILWLCGEDRTAIDGGAADIVAVPVYAILPQPVPAAWVNTIERPAMVLLHSARAAAHVAALAGSARQHLIGIAISAAVKAAAGPGWERCVNAAEPRDGAMLALAAELCQTAPGQGC